MTSEPQGDNYDPNARTSDSGVREVNPPAYFLAKHEMTRMQWWHLTDRLDPSPVAPIEEPIYFRIDGVEY